MPTRWAIGEIRTKSKVLATDPQVNGPNNPEIGLPEGFAAVRAKPFFLPVQNRLYKYLSRGVAKARSRLYVDVRCLLDNSFLSLRICLYFSI
jgi:hypothetical protein